MCGIVGQIEKNNHIDKHNFDKMRDTLIHRGPDGANTWINESNNIALGHRRLSFLDLSDLGSQPMSDTENFFYITFNGEIYNYIELRDELKSKGYHFKTNTDTEVILIGFKEWGKGILNKLKGMFAFGIWDDNQGKLFLARDRFGIKPLYYLYDKERLVFASEIKGIKKCEYVNTTVDFSSVADYLTYRFVPSPKTIWKEVAKLPPAHFLEYDFDSHKIVVGEYWKLEFNDHKVSRKEAVNRVGELMNQSVEQHLRSDVPIGTFLSGGYDSSALALFMTQQGYTPYAFSIGFDNWKKSEDQYAEIVARYLKIPLNKTIVGKEQLSLLPKLMYHYDEPIADISIIPTYLVSQLASTKVKAVLSGEGADEIFVGYEWQKKIAEEKVLYPEELVHRYSKAMAMGHYLYNDIIDLLHPDIVEEIPKDSNWFYSQQIKLGLSSLKTFQYLDVKSFMGELVLTKIDRASMAHSLETRVPFLDHELVEYTCKLHTSVLYDRKTTKLLLHNNIKGHLPQEILQRKKQGFVGPDTYYMDYSWYVENLVGGRLIKEGIIQEKALTRLIAKNEHWKLWKLAVLEFWWRKWV